MIICVGYAQIELYPNFVPDNQCVINIIVKFIGGGGGGGGCLAWAFPGPFALFLLGIIYLLLLLIFPIKLKL